MNQFLIEELSNWYSPDKRILFITGAGISVDSGLPTYRGVAGLYEEKETEDNVPIEVALSGGMFQSRPELTWKYLMQIGEACRCKTFNRGHLILAELEDCFEQVWVLTQNIDGFHLDAGSSNVIEIHGTMRRLVCTDCGEVTPMGELDVDHVPPVCKACHGMMRPDVVLFDERLPAEATEELQLQLQTGFDAVLVVGTSALFPYISHPVHLANRSGSLTIEINPATTDLSSLVDFKLDLPATEGLQLFQDALLGIVGQADREKRC